MTPEVYALNADARKLLAYLHRRSFELGGGPYSVGNNSTTFAATTIVPSQFVAVARRLVTKRLAQNMGMGGSVMITPLGIETFEDPPSLDRLLPIGAPASRPAPAVEVAEALREIRSVSLDFMVDGDLRAIVERDLDELDAAIVAGLHKCSAILAGSVVEGLLIDMLDQNRAIAQTHMAQRRHFPEDASLGDLVDIATKEMLLEAVASGLVDHLKDFRDLVHPDRERRTKPKVDAATAGALVSLLRLVVRDLVAAARDGKLAAYLAK